MTLGGIGVIAVDATGSQGVADAGRYWICSQNNCSTTKALMALGSISAREGVAAGDVVGAGRYQHQSGCGDSMAEASLTLRGICVRNSTKSAWVGLCWCRKVLILDQMRLQHGKGTIYNTSH